MAYDYPEEYLAWYNVGERIALVTSKNTSNKNTFESIDESTSNGLLIEYSAQPREIENLSDVPEVDDTLHPALVNYINWKLFEDRLDEVSTASAMKYRALWETTVRQEAGRDKVGGQRAIVPFGLR
jgi:hypothetical protein